MGCIAQVCPDKVTVRCICPTPCPPFAFAPDCFIEQKEINCCIIKGTVKCAKPVYEGEPPVPVFPPVPGAIVFAKNTTTGETFAGITNGDGEYCICVAECGDYEIECFCCPEDCCDLVDCFCACNGDLNHQEPEPEPEA